MGEATYYLQAEFTDWEEAEKAAGKASRFFARVCLCQDRWQETRSKGESKETDNALRAEFPDVFETLKIEQPDKIDQSINYLAGQLDGPDERNDGIVEADGCFVRCSGTVRHMADWDKFCEYFKSLGAIRQQGGKEESGRRKAEGGAA